MGRLQPVLPREVWPHEALDFTPWLLTNVGVLTDLLGMDLILEVAEHPVDGFSLDRGRRHWGMPYDPDGDPNIDPDDLDAVDAMLDHPVDQKLVEELGRQFRALPPEEQIEDLATQMMRLTSMRDELSARIEADEAPPDDPRRTLLDAMNGHVEGFRRRITEVRDQPSG